MWRPKRLKAAVAGFLLGAVFACTATQAVGYASVGTIAVITLTELSEQGLKTYRLIYQGGLFENGKDGVVFANRECLLPIKTRGYYHEYTVLTPGRRDRGIRRIVCGGQATSQPDICYYTDDHYASFRRIVP